MAALLRFSDYTCSFRVALFARGTHSAPKRGHLLGLPWKLGVPHDSDAERRQYSLERIDRGAILFELAVDRLDESSAHGSVLLRTSDLRWRLSRNAAVFSCSRGYDVDQHLFAT